MSVLVGSAADYASISVDGSQEAAYVAKVLALSPIAYWILGEHEGTVAYCSVNANQNGTHTGVTLGNTGIGDGQVCPQYDGAASYTDVYSATLASRFSGNEGTAAMWARVIDGNVWSDGIVRYALRIAVDANNEVVFFKASAADLFRTTYEASGTVKGGAGFAVSDTAWHHYAMSWSASADEVKFFLDGAQPGATATGLGVWVGTPASTTTVIGAFVTTPLTVWSGLAAHVALWDSVLTPAQIASLASV